MRRIAVTALPALVAALALGPAPVAAEMIGGNPGPQYNYVCPHADGQDAMACFFDAVEHLYTMCRNVKSIEILTYGYEESLDGVNAAKYESCVEKQKHNMDKPYRAALKEARNAKAVVAALRSLHDDWASALVKLRWNRGESDGDYKARVAAPYDDFHQRIGSIKVLLAEQKSGTAVASARAQSRKPAAHAPARKAASTGKAPAAKAAAARDKAPQS